MLVEDSAIFSIDRYFRGAVELVAEAMKGSSYGGGFAARLVADRGAGDGGDGCVDGRVDGYGEPTGGRLSPRTPSAPSLDVLPAGGPKLASFL